MRHLQSIIKPWDFWEETIVYPEAEICRSNTCKYMHDVWYNISSSIFVDGLNNIFKIHMYYTIIKKKTKSNQRYWNEHNKLHSIHRTKSPSFDFTKSRSTCVHLKLINRSTSKGNIDPSIYVMKINLYMFYLIQINYTRTYYIRNLIVINLLTRVIPFHKPISACIRI